MVGNYSMLYSGVSQETRAQSGIALIIDHKWTSRIKKLLICQQSHIIRSPQNQQRPHNYNRSLCSGRRQRGRSESFLQTTTKRS